MRRTFSRVLFFASTVLASCSTEEMRTDQDAALDDAVGTDAPVDGWWRDASSDNPGFTPPTQVTKANVKVGDVWMEIGDADWSCVNTRTDDLPPNGQITLTGNVRDIASNVAVGNQRVVAFEYFDWPTLRGDVWSSDGSFSMSVAPLPSNARRYTFQVAGNPGDGYVRTTTLDRYLLPGMAQSMDVPMFSESTANALPAFVGATRDPQKAMVVGSMVDCQGRAVSNAAVTVVQEGGTGPWMPELTTYYYDAGATTSVPVNHSQARHLNKDGLFLILDVPVVVEEPFTRRGITIQVWGFRTAAELESGWLTNFANVNARVAADSVIYAQVLPKRAP